MRSFGVLKIILLALTVALFASAALAEAPAPTRDQAKEMVEKAIAFAKANGKDATLAEIGKKDGKFSAGPALFVFAHNLDGNILAHPFVPALVGKDMSKVQDADGKFFSLEFAKMAKSGGGWVDYKFTNPATKKTEPKTTYTKMVGDYAIACGIFVK